METKFRLLEDFRRQVAETNYCRAWAARHALAEMGLDVSGLAKAIAQRFQNEVRNLDSKINNAVILDLLNRPDNNEPASFVKRDSLPANFDRLLEGYQPPIDGDRRASEVTAIAQACGSLPTKPYALVAFLQLQAARWVADYGLVTIDFGPVTTSPPRKPTTKDPASLLLQSAEEDSSHFQDAIAASEFEAFRNLPGLPFRQRLRASLGEAAVRSNLGQYYAATVLLRGALAELEDADTDADMAQLQGMADGALGLLQTVRLLADSEVDFRFCCGPVVSLPLPAPEELQVATELISRYARQTVGERDPNKSPVTRNDLLQHKSAVLAALSRDIAASWDIQTQLQNYGTCICCTDLLGEEAAPLAPQLLNVILSTTGYGKGASVALAKIGPAAASALPALVLCLERDKNPTLLQNTRFAISKLGRAPRRAMPYLGRLLYHPNPIVALNSATLIKDSTLLPPEVQARLTNDGLTSQIQAWWESTGSLQSWMDQNTPPGGTRADSGSGKP
jgi:hypothetical protein